MVLGCVVRAEFGRGPRLLQSVVQGIAEELAASPGVGGHVHFDDDPELHGLVPAPTSTAWLDLGRRAAAAVSGVGGRFVVVIPLGIWPEPPITSQMEELGVLQPYDLPGIYILTEGNSAYAERTRSASRWFSDDPSDPPGAVAWFAGHKRDGAGGSPVWRVALMLETT